MGDIGRPHWQTPLVCRGRHWSAPGSGRARGCDDRSWSGAGLQGVAVTAPAVTACWPSPGQNPDKTSYNPAETAITPRPCRASWRAGWHPSTASTRPSRPHCCRRARATSSTARFLPRPRGRTGARLWRGIRDLRHAVLRIVDIPLFVEGGELLVANGGSFSATPTATPCTSRPPPAPERGPQRPGGQRSWHQHRRDRDHPARRPDRRAGAGRDGAREAGALPAEPGLGVPAHDAGCRRRLRVRRRPGRYYAGQFPRCPARVDLGSLRPRRPGYAKAPRT